MSIDFAITVAIVPQLDQVEETYEVRIARGNSATGIPGFHSRTRAERVASMLRKAYAEEERQREAYFNKQVERLEAGR